MDDNARIIREAIAEIERHTAWKSDSHDEEPYPATDDDYRRVVLASDLHKMAESLAAPPPASVPSDDGPADEHDLEALDFTVRADEPGTNVYDKILGVGRGGPIVRVWIEYNRGEQVKSGLGLHWDYLTGTGKISMAFAIRDNPTADDVRRLLAELDPK